MNSLALIGRDEIQGLKDLVGDVGRYFDEIILISTNHDKKFMKEAKKLGCKVFDEYFGQSGVDFDSSAARNSSFNHCKGDIIAWFDLDDRIPNANVIPLIFEAMEETDWVYCTYNYAFNQYGDVLVKHLKPRFVKKGTGHWQTTPHDDFVSDKSIISSVDSDFLVKPLLVNHQNVYGTEEDLEKVKRRAERNLGIMLNELKRDGDKTDLRTIQYIGTTLLSLERYEEAISFLMKHYKSTGAKEDRFWSLKKMSFCYRMLGDFDKAINLLLEGLKFYPNWQTMYFALADIYSQMGEHKKVIEWTLSGMSKEVPKTAQIIEPLEYELNPMGRLADAYLMTNQLDKALQIAEVLAKKYPNNVTCKELLETTKSAIRTEDFVTSFLKVSSGIRKTDRLKAIKLFECLPNKLDEDIRIQAQRFIIVPPKQWSDKSIVIYCGRALEDWAYPSIFSGIGGSEYAVIMMSKELTKLGYEVTVYNQCGDFRGTYDGVEYLPFYQFNPNDNFNTVIGWRTPRMFESTIRAKKKIVWLHDIASGWQFSDKAIKNTDKFVFLSKWHRNNKPDIPEEKVFISNNGIDAEMFDDYIGNGNFKSGAVKKTNSLCWSSSYDRGLLPFIKNIFPLIKKKLPDVTLEVAYGWHNIDKEMEIIPELKNLRAELTPLLEGEGIIHHGRLNEKEVADMYKRSMVMPYASEFGETNNISSQKAQASNCYVITTQQAGGTPEYLKFGEAVPFDNIYTDKKAQEYFAKRVIEYLKNPKNAPEWIVEGFSWGKTAKLWEEGLL